MAAVVLLGALTLTVACTGNTDAAPTTPGSRTSSALVPEVSESPSTTPTTTVSFVPVAPKEPPPVPVPEQTPESAVAFLKWWISALNYAELTGITKPVLDYSLPECIFCNAQIERIDDVYSAGNSIERSGDTTLIDLAPSPLDLDASVLVEATGQSPPTRFLNAAGEVTESSAGTDPAPLLIGLAWVDSGWKVRGVADV